MNIRLILSVLLMTGAVLGCRTAAARTTDFRLNEVEIAGFPAAWTSLAGAFTNMADIVRAADRDLRDPIPELTDEDYLRFTKTGDRDIYQRPYFCRLHQLERLVLAESRTRKGIYLERLAEQLEAICSERSWVMPAHDPKLKAFDGTRLFIDLGVGSRSEAVARALALCGDRLPEATVARCLRELRRRMIGPYLDLARGGAAARYPEHWWAKTSNNWNAVCHSSAVRVILSVCSDTQERELAISFAKKASELFLAGFTDEGYCTEGAGYWNYGFGQYLKLALAVRTATEGRVDFLADPKWRRVMAYGRGYWLDGRHAPSFADGTGVPAPFVLALCRAACPTEDFGRRLEAFTAFPEAQVFICRTAKADAALAFKGGHNDEFHNHNDLGSWEYLVDGDPVAGDPGGERYTARTFSAKRYESKVLNSYGHPVPVVGGKLQSAGRDFAAQVVSAVTEGTARKVTLDLRKAYDDPGLARFERTFSFDEATGVATVADEVEFATASSLQESLPTYAGVLSEGDGSLVLSTARARVRVTTASEGGVFVRTEEELPNPPRAAVRRVTWTSAAPATRFRFEMTLTPLRDPSVGR